MGFAIDNSEIHIVEKVQDIWCGLNHLYESLFEDIDYLCRRSFHINSANLLQLHNLNERNCRNRIFAVTAFYVLTYGDGKTPIVGKIPYKGFRIQQILH